MATAISKADRLSLNPSGAITIFFILLLI